MMTDISQKLKSDIKAEDLKQENGILCYMNDYFISGDNQKYMKMYDWMSFFYDFGEKWIGRLKYGHAIDHLRTELMSRLEWKNNISVLYVSIGTGADLHYLPQGIDLKTIDLVGVDIFFHIGGINFFNDKTRAMSEMLRVAKAGSKLLIADETADFVETQYKKSVFSKSYFEDKTVDLNAIEQCIPISVTEKKTELFWDNKFYGITFRKSN